MTTSATSHPENSMSFFDAILSLVGLYANAAVANQIVPTKKSPALNIAIDKINIVIDARPKRTMLTVIFIHFNVLSSI